MTRTLKEFLLYVFIRYTVNVQHLSYFVIVCIFKKKNYCVVLFCQIFYWPFFILWYAMLYYRIGDVIVSGLASSVVDRDSSSNRVKPKIIKLVLFVGSSLGTLHYAKRAKTYWLRIRIMCRVGRHVYPRTVVSVS